MYNDYEEDDEIEEMEEMMGDYDLNDPDELAGFFDELKKIGKRVTFKGGKLSLSKKKKKRKKGKKGKKGKRSKTAGISPMILGLGAGGALLLLMLLKKK